jgi:hypothetical protein
MKLPTILERRRLASPAVAPQALAWDGTRGALWMGSRDLRRVYAIDPAEWKVTEDIETPGIPWAAVATNGSLRFTIGEDPDDDRYIRRFIPQTGSFGSERIACPEFTGSYLSYDGDSLYLSQWYEHRILRLDNEGKINRVIDVGAEICGHTFVNRTIYVLRGSEKPTEDWRIARIDPTKETPEVKDLALVPFASRSLAFDGKLFWSNHRAANEIIAFSLPE